MVACHRVSVHMRLTACTLTCFPLRWKPAETTMFRWRCTLQKRAMNWNCSDRLQGVWPNFCETWNCGIPTYSFQLERQCIIWNGSHEFPTHSLSTATT